MFWLESDLNDMYQLCWQKDPGSSVNLTVSMDHKTNGRPQYEDAASFAFCPIGQLEMPLRLNLLGTDNYTFEHISGEGEPAPASPTAVWTVGFTSSAPPNIKRIITTSLGDVLGNVAKSLTKLTVVRSNRTVSGISTRSEVHVAVEGAWLGLPAALLLLSLVFFVSTVVVSRRQNLALWKSSVLPTIYHGLEDNAFMDGDEHATISRMGLNARSVDVRLEESSAKQRLMLRT